MDSVLDDLQSYKNVIKHIPVPSPDIKEPKDVLAYRVEVAQSLIEEDIQRGIIPENIGSFSELHDYIDANLYLVDDNTAPRLGSFFNWSEFWLDEEGIEIDTDSVYKLLNMMLEAIDCWLEDGRNKKVTEYLKSENAC